MHKGLIAKASISISAPSREVWQALVDPEAISQYMFGTTAVSDWREGRPIVWKGEWKGEAYEDKGVILQLEPGRRITYSHFSPLSGLPDEPQNYHTVTVELTAGGEQEGVGDQAVGGEQTHVSLEQDNNASEEARAHSEQNWQAMLAALKELVER